MEAKKFKIIFEKNEITSCKPTVKKIAMRGSDWEQKWGMSKSKDGVVTLYLQPDNPQDVLNEAKAIYNSETSMRFISKEESEANRAKYKMEKDKLRKRK